MRKPIYFPAWMSVLVKVGEGSNMQRVANELELSYSHVFVIMKELENMGYCTSEKKGRLRLWSFSEKGKKIRNLLGLLQYEIK
jgi:Mn-dependent DtxR family transcriptional regulator